jgi:DNA-binding CsgD family transcriptional regulator
MVVAHFITEQKKVREELALYRQELESLVRARTAELAKINRQLRKEIEQRKQTAMELRASSDRLHEMNTAMSVLLDKRSEDHQRAEELIRLNLKELIDPFLNRLENSGLRGTQKQLLEIIRMNLEEVLGSPTPEFSSKYYMFSPNELQVANLIRQGRTSKEVARLLNLSTRTVDSYRDSIRKKLGLKNKKVNLRTYLASL